MSVVASMIEQISEAVAADDDRRFLACGGCTKQALTQVEDVERFDMRLHCGILTYDPSEFLISAKAGTRVTDLQLALSEHGQYLPCDPLFGAAGSTIGGTLASGFSGSNRLLYGGLRDFIMEVEMIDGTGAVIRGGGKVVKNAAGFDIPKLLVGSYGRLGIITEVTFKVFPRPNAFATLRVRCKHITQAIEQSQKLLSKPFPIAALDLIASEGQRDDEEIELLVRCGAPSDSVTAVLERMQRVLGCSGETLHDAADAKLWCQQASFVEREATAGECLLRIAIHPARVAEFEQRRRSLPTNSTVTYTGGCSVAWIRLQNSDLNKMDGLLTQLKLSAIIVLGSTGELSKHLGIGNVIWRDSANRIQQALDPRQRFLAY